eukprot:scaffold35194_cov118-Isochrysis_galbana.AAC.5
MTCHRPPQHHNSAHVYIKISEREQHRTAACCARRAPGGAASSFSRRRGASAFCPRRSTPT